MGAIRFCVFLVFCAAWVVHGLPENDFKPPSDEQVADFQKWIAHVGNKASLKAQAKASSLTTKTKIPESKQQASGRVIVVDQQGKGQFYTIKDAVNSITKDSQRQERITIMVNAGTYREQVVIAKNLPLITLQGAGRQVTTIVHSETEAEAGNDIGDATLAISAPYFIARDITIQNSAPAPPSGAVGKQATALYISGDMAAFYSCGILGAQDTLYDHSGRHYFESCFIQGSIDFIYGDGLSLYKSCDLHVISVKTGSLTAQKRSSTSEDTGFSFVDCTVDGTGRVYLGRAWGASSRVVFASTYLGPIIIPQGWYNWGITARQQTVYYGEYHCYGPGANRQGRVYWSKSLTDAEAAPFLSIGFIDGEDWLSE